MASGVVLVLAVLSGQSAALASVPGDGSAAPVQLVAVPLCQPDDDVANFTIPAARAQELSALVAAHGPLRVAMEPWGVERPRCLCSNLAVYSSDGSRREAVVVEPPFGSRDLFDEDAAKLVKAARHMLEPPARGRSPLSQIPLLQPDLAVAGLTLHHWFTDELALLAGELAPAARLRVAEQPWGDVRPKCMCKQLAVFSPDGSRHTTFTIEPVLGAFTHPLYGTQDLQDDDAAKLVQAVSVVLGPATDGIDWRRFFRVLPSALGY